MKILHDQQVDEMVKTIQNHATLHGHKPISPRVIRAIRQVQRHKFVEISPYGDHPVSIGYSQTISQPFIVAYMTEMLEIQPSHKVLEIGMGSGYQAAVLSELAHEIYTVERIPELAQRTKQLFETLEDYESIKVKVGNGVEGWKEHAPYDRIIVTAMANEIPVELTKQLVDGGKMIVPIEGKLLLITKKKEIAGVPVLEQKNLIGVRFVPLIDNDSNK